MLGLPILYLKGMRLSMFQLSGFYLGGCQNYHPFLGPYYNTAPIISGTQKGTIILTTTHFKLSTVLISKRLFQFKALWVGSLWRLPVPLPGRNPDPRV